MARAAALEAAYKRGYYMAEIDIRPTKDCQLMILHDATLNNYYHVNKAAKDLTWEEIRGLKSDRDGSSPILLEDALKYCKGRLQVMLDTKIAGNDTVNFKKIETLLRKYDLLDKALFIGSNEIRSYFNGKSKTGYSINALKQLKSQSEFNPERYFLFSHGNEIKEEDVKWAQANHVMVVPSINKYHYRDIAFMEGAKRDIENLKKWGVVYYQIDSEFDQWLSR